MLRKFKKHWRNKRANKLKNCDYLIGNLETPAAGEELLYTHERYCFNTPHALLDALKKSGFDITRVGLTHHPRRQARRRRHPRHD